MRGIFALACVVWLAGLSPGLGATRTTGTDLRSHCSANDYDFLRCVTYVRAIADVLEEDSIYSYEACVPKTATLGQLVDIARAFLDDNPAKIHLSAHYLVTRAFSEAFPCP